MKYTPKRTDLKIRLIYSISFVLSVFCMIFNGDPRYKVYFSSLGLIFLIASLFIFIKFEFTTYEYILLERNNTFDFYVNKITGRRGSYVCYFPLTDACEICEYSKEAKVNLKEKYSNITFFKYDQNIFCGKKYALIFNDNGNYLAIIIEPSDDFVKMVEDEIARLSEIELENNNYDATIDISTDTENI